MFKSIPIDFEYMIFDRVLHFNCSLREHFHHNVRVDPPRPKFFLRIDEVQSHTIELLHERDFLSIVVPIMKDLNSLLTVIGLSPNLIQT